MRSTNFCRARLRGAGLVLAAAAFALLSSAGDVSAATWKGLEPFVSKRADVERVLGAPVSDRFAEDGTLEFDVSGGHVTVFFVTPKFVASKKLPAHYEGTVLQIVLQHERAQDTPESLGVDKNKHFERQAQQGNTVAYANAREGISYTFVDNHLRTTRYSAPAEQLAKAFKRKG